MNTKEKKELDIIVSKVDKMLNNDIKHLDAKLDILNNSILSMGTELNVTLNKLTDLLEERFSIKK